MSLSLNIAKRYLFSHKKTSAINIISSIATLGIGLGCAALLVIMSVFNGLEGLIASLYNSFNPDIKITAVTGKTFECDSTLMTKIAAIDGVVGISQTIEEVAFFKYKDSEHFGILKGVDKNYATITKIDSSIEAGNFNLNKNGVYQAVVGYGVDYFLDININNPMQSLHIYVPKKKNNGGFITQAFNQRRINPVGVFMTEQEIDSKYVIVDLGLARDLLEINENTLGALEIKTNPSKNTLEIQKKLQVLLGKDVQVNNGRQQEAAFYRLMKIEKWVAYAVLSLTLVLVAFNMIGSLWMLVLEKKSDIAILKSMGATNQLIKKIFISQGLLMTLIGLIGGLILGMILVFLQKQFGFVKFQADGNFVVDAYPVELKIFDMLVIAITISGIGWLASYLPSLRASEIKTLIKDI